MANKKVIGGKNTVIKAIPKPLFRMLVQIQMEMELNKKNSKKVTLLEAGIELTKRVRK